MPKIFSCVYSESAAQPLKSPLFFFCEEEGKNNSPGLVRWLLEHTEQEQSAGQFCPPVPAEGFAVRELSSILFVF